MKHGKMILGELHADIPVIQGGMGVGISLSGLAGAVAAAGGIGIISTAQIGFREPDFDRDPIACNLRTIGKEIEKARQIARGGIVGVNIMVATQRYEDYVRAAVLAGTDCIISGAGLPLDLPGIVAETEDRMPGRSHRTMLAPIVSSTRALSVVTKYWMKKYDRKPDFIVAEGPLAGGHLGFKREELDAYTPENYERELMAMIRKAAELEIPLIAAGGIYDRRDMEHCLSLGAAGVQLGTRFVTTEECDAAEAYKQEYLREQKENIVNVMTNEFPAGVSKKAYVQCVLIEKNENDYRPTKSFLQMPSNGEFYDILQELVEFGISRYERDYSNTYDQTDFVLYQKYTYEDVCRLLNWEQNEVPLNIGGYKYDRKTKTFPVFINYDKAEDISDTTKYEDHFVPGFRDRLIAISKSGRSLQSEDVQNFLKAKERGIHVELFVRKNKDDKISKEFYYLGHMTASGKTKEFKMTNTEKTAVEIEWILDVPVREDIYEYIVNS